ncbi:Por secretion system C-terminal sorting domain-containing protein [Algoriella xinjiangensis]|uniref:Por secretion system C-terminal sorting domain-containing protein n=1 Tax=Algoriella xinjiangensis TaxID=684065 RepID=A0A1I4WJP4_9FLAO|nr:M36 family metallopeptidase [Algoriella xinjiangensis]SFN13189.1 Por secretion system C-terminal sorting domain-containing protein [Algoriella xinjiangensis]VDH16915.1 Arginyl aminopeptidase [Algoriella xinjiangensis]
MKKNLTLIFSAFVLSMYAHAQTAEQIVDNYETQAIASNVEYKFAQTIDDDATQRVYTQRTFQGIPIYNSYSTYVIKNKQVISKTASENFNISLKNAAVSPALSFDQVINKIAQAEGLKVIADTKVNQNGVYISKDDAAEIVYYINNENQAILSYAFSYQLVKENQNDIIHVVIDAINGSVLEKHNNTLSCGHNHGSFHNENLATFNKADWDWLYDDAVNTASPQYNVYQLPLEAPNRGARTFADQAVSNTTASPNGWHNTAEGSVKTRTEGNNTRTARDHESKGYQTYSSSTNTVTIKDTDYADGGSALNFDFPIDLTNHPYTNWEAATTNLFYMNNMMHDIFYNYGFTEANGNFQKINFDKGGTGNDDVVALAQTGLALGAVNNATFATPADGKSPRMAMYLWNKTPEPLIINSPSNIAGNYQATIPTWGGTLTSTPLTKDFVLILKSETTGTPYDGCGTFTNTAEINDKIAIIYRGDCPFATKVKNAQNAGAKAAIIVNNVDGMINMSGDDTTITIPALSISKADGDKIVKELQNKVIVNGSLVKTEVSYIDGSLDNGIIAHEYGHGISNRLTGPITNANCLNNLEQMGEGWSDFFGLMITQLPTDKSTTKRGIGTFATNDAIDGSGIRATAYSTDMTVNPARYGFLKTYGNSDSPHNTGYVWASMVWDLNWKMIDKYGFSPDLYNGKAGNNMALQLVMTGLKLQPCSPGFVSGRDAIIMADEQLNEGANKCDIWSVFARRGLGYSALQGSTNSRTDGTEAFDMPPVEVLNCELSTSELKDSTFQIYPNPTKDVVYIVDKTIKNDIKVDIIDMVGKVVSTQTVKFDGQKGSLTTNNLPKGIYILKFKTDNGTITKKLIKN